MVTGRGCAIVLENGFSGTLRLSQTVKLASHTMRVEAVEIAHTGANGWAVLVVSEQHFALAKAQVGNLILEDA
jgi:hypothetical protein